MTYREPARIRIRRLRVAGLLIALAAIALVLGDQLSATSSSTTPSFLSPPAALATSAPPREPRAGLGMADGAVPDGTSVFDDRVPGVAKLDPALLAALRQAATDAAAVGVEFTVDSGWRSRAYQARLLRDAVLEYGSEAEAARWVATPGTSAHVSGDAVDIGPAAATTWLSERGGAYGLCPVYGNEPWHYELRPDAGAHGCPPMYADPTHDPRMHR